mmetsp:Transcript_71762/g.181325  ORF Transcript_71762/g.181325 Transcript_71762/m.181325 type:complete len:308 (-) Transcript_71762:21-944(-)
MQFLSQTCVRGGRLPDLADQVLPVLQKPRREVPELGNLRLQDGALARERSFLLSRCSHGCLYTGEILTVLGNDEMQLLPLRIQALQLGAHDLPRSLKPLPLGSCLLCKGCVRVAEGEDSPLETLRAVLGVGHTSHRGRGGVGDLGDLGLHFTHLQLRLRDPPAQQPLLPLERSRGRADLGQLDGRLLEGLTVLAGHALGTADLALEALNLHTVLASRVLGLERCRGLRLDLRHQALAAPLQLLQAAIAGAPCKRKRDGGHGDGTASLSVAQAATLGIGLSMATKPHSQPPVAVARRAEGTRKPDLLN